MEHRIDRLLPYAVGVVIMLSLVAVFVAPVGHDASWYIVAAQHIIDGEVLYRDIGVEPNPPLIYLLNIPPILCARLIDAPLDVTFKVWVSLLMLASIALSSWSLRGSMPELSQSAIWLVRAVLVALLFPLSMSAGASNHFGQREHLMLGFSLPYILSVAASGNGPAARSWHRALIIGAASVGFVIKPHFLLVPLVLELQLLASRGTRAGWIRAESIIISAVAFAYGLFVLLAFPAYLEIVSMAREVYGAYDAPLLSMLLRPEIFLWLVAAGAVAAIRPRKGERLPSVLLLASLALIVAAILQGKWWRYHFYPGLATTWLALAVVGISLLERRELCEAVLRVPQQLVALLLILALGLGAGLRIGAADTGGKAGAMIFADAIERFAAGRTVIALSTSVPPVFPAVLYSSAKWGLRFPCVWMLRGVYAQQSRRGGPFPHQEPEEQTRVERYLVDAIISDMQRRKPALVVVDRSPREQALGFGQFDWLEYLGTDPRFPAIWKHYRSVGRLWSQHEFFVRAH